MKTISDLKVGDEVYLFKNNEYVPYAYVGVELKDAYNYYFTISNDTEVKRYKIKFKNDLPKQVYLEKKPKQRFEFKKTLNGDLYVTMKVPVSYKVNATFEEYGDGTFGEDYESSVDNALEQNKIIKSDIETFKRLGWNIEEILIE